jgi:hypothetical protein
MVKVKIKATVITAQYGTLQSGDILNTNEAFAKHLVDDCAAADYLTVEKSETKSSASQPASQPARKNVAKAKA